MRCQQTRGDDISDHARWCLHEIPCFLDLVRLVRTDSANTVEQKLPFRFEPVVEVAAIRRAPLLVNDEGSQGDLFVRRNVDRDGNREVLRRRYIESPSDVPRSSGSLARRTHGMVSNIIRHGYADRQPHEIGIYVEVLPRSIELTIDDDGRPFDPNSAQPVPVPASLDEAPTGGMGLSLVRNIAGPIEGISCDPVRYKTLRVTF